jgi:hypothetical protein
MIDALLFAVRKACWDYLKYDQANCDVRVDGRPPDCGDFYLAISEAGASSLMDNALDEYFAFDLTVTHKVYVPLDRIGDQQLASKLSRVRGPKGSPSLNERTERLSHFFHMNWGVLQDANLNLAEFAQSDHAVYGFAEPARYRTTELPRFEGGDWFWAKPEADKVGLVSVVHFDDCRRLQALTVFI